MVASLVLLLLYVEAAMSVKYYSYAFSSMPLLCFIIRAACVLANNHAVEYIDSLTNPNPNPNPNKVMLSRLNLHV